MLFFYRAKLVILSEPKTGTTALLNALQGRASIVVNSPPAMKHIPYRKFMKFVAPWIKGQTGLEREQYDVVTVMREPSEWLGSWYRYRTRDVLQDADNPRASNYTGDLSFDDFVQGVCKPRKERPEWARINSPCAVAMNSKTSIGVDRLYSYADLSGLYELISERTGKPVQTKQLNVSPSLPLVLSDENTSRLREHMAFAYDLYESLRPDGMIQEKFRLDAVDDDDEAED